MSRSQYKNALVIAVKQRRKVIFVTTKEIPNVDQRAASRVPVIPAPAPGTGGTRADTRGRLLRDLRISVTDRCNFRCTYCMPKSVFGTAYKIGRASCRERVLQVV